MEGESGKRCEGAARSCEDFAQFRKPYKPAHKVNEAGERERREWTRERVD